MSSHKGSWSRVRDKKAYDDCPLWDNIEKAKKKTKKKTTNNTISVAKK
jgi:hypothetical protein